jgi:hypothetical protein
MEIMIGVSRPDNDLQTYFSQNEMGWGLYLAHGKAYHNDEGRPLIYTKIRPGDTIKCSIDRYEGIITYSINDEIEQNPIHDSGICTGDLFPAISMAEEGDIVRLENRSEMASTLKSPLLSPRF